MEIIIFDFLETTCYSAERRASSGVLLPLLAPPSALGGTERGRVKSGRRHKYSTKWTVSDSDTSSVTPFGKKKNMLTAYVEYFVRK